MRGVRGVYVTCCQLPCFLCLCPLSALPLSPLFLPLSFHNNKQQQTRGMRDESHFLVVVSQLFANWGKARNQYQFARRAWIIFFLFIFSLWIGGCVVKQQTPTVSVITAQRTFHEWNQNQMRNEHRLKAATSAAQWLRSFAFCQSPFSLPSGSPLLDSLIFPCALCLLLFFRVFSGGCWVGVICLSAGWALGGSSSNSGLTQHNNFCLSLSKGAGNGKLESDEIRECA